MATEKTAPRTKTIRKEMVEFLLKEELTARDLSQLLGIRQKEVAGHLKHIGRSAAPHGQLLKMRPSSCLSCGYVFKERTRLTQPSRCPECKGTHLEAPTYRMISPPA